MSVAPGAALDVPREQIVEEEAAPPSIWRTLLTSSEGRVGIALGLLMLALILFGRFFAPFSPTEIGTGPPASGPTADNILGTDHLGRDVLSRFLAGGDTILVVPLIAVTLAFLAGGGLGMLGGYLRGWPDAVITRTFDLLLTLPPLLLVLVVIAGLGTSRVVLVVTVALVFLPRMGRVVRGATQAVVTNDYVAAAQARGERTSAIVVREVLPNIAAPAIADFALRITYAIIFVATLNFLGLGAQPPAPDWGLMVSESRAFIAVAPWATLAPAVGIAALSVAFNFVADALTRHLTRESAKGVVPL
ncbi:MAG TPA: ABC transporter permease [Actinomycetota bacterium]|nr:ABC transporter permease [Actinomycetota bacterium]